ncbi:MAG: pyridoxal-dependent decarboxylase [Acidimicrobiales bacterium]
MSTAPLDPLDLDAFRRHGHALIDWIAAYLEGLEGRPVREPVAPGDVRGKLPATAPEEPESFEAVLADLDDIVVPGLSHWQHPGWFAFFPAMSSPAAADCG